MVLSAGFDDQRQAPIADLVPAGNRGLSLVIEPGAQHHWGRETARSRLSTSSSKSPGPASGKLLPPLDPRCSYGYQPVVGGAPDAGNAMSRAWAFAARCKMQEGRYQMKPQNSRRRC